MIRAQQQRERLESRLAERTMALTEALAEVEARTTELTHARETIRRLSRTDGSRAIRSLATFSLVAAIGLIAVTPALAHGVGEGEGASPVVTHLDSTATVARSEGAQPAVTHLDSTTTVAPRRFAAAAASQDDVPGGLPARWCGDASAAALADDDPGLGTASFKLVYAHFADRPSRFPQFADRLQQSASIVARALAQEAEGTKTIRFEMGTSCGANYVDIQELALASPRADYLDQGRPRTTKIKDEIRARLPAAAGPRNVTTYLDAATDGGASGVGELYFRASIPGAGNPNHDGGLLSLLFGEVDPGASLDRLPHLLLHEAGHNLGAVNIGAPHSDGAGHCLDEADVMCYGAGTFSACAPLAGAILERFDCGRDDYFNPNPAPGSYLATHWNVYDSPFLGPCRELAVACGAREPSAADPPQGAVLTAAASARAKARARAKASARAKARMRAKVRASKRARARATAIARARSRRRALPRS